MNDVISLGHRSQLVKNFLKHVIHDSKEIIRKKLLFLKYTDIILQEIMLYI